MLVKVQPTDASAAARPSWLKARAPQGPNYHELKTLVETNRLHTICESAHCPNIGECWEQRTATFMILGNVCTRRCGFCAVQKGRPLEIDWDEPRRVADAVQKLGLEYAVVTSVDRDDQKDGGATLFARTIEAIHRLNPTCRVEVLIPDFQGSLESLKIVLDAHPDVLNHNIETVARLYRTVRPGSHYRRSLALLDASKDIAPAIPTKSGIMLGLSEEWYEVVQTLRDLRWHHVDVVTIGQYLRPSPRHLPISRYYTPEEFQQFGVTAEQLGFRYIESGPLVRSSYHAKRAVSVFTEPAASTTGEVSTPLPDLEPPRLFVP